MQFRGLRNTGFDWKSRKSRRALYAEYEGLISSTDMAKLLRSFGYKGVTTADVESAGGDHAAEWHHVYAGGMKALWFFRPEVAKDSEFLAKVLEARDTRRARARERVRIEYDPILHVHEDGTWETYYVWRVRVKAKDGCWPFAGTFETREEAEAAAERIRAEMRTRRKLNS